MSASIFLAWKKKIIYLPGTILRMDQIQAAEQWPDIDTRTIERSAAEKAAKHANTPATVFFDSLGRPFLRVANNGKDQDGNDIFYETRTVMDIEGNQRAIIDALKRVVMRYDYFMAGPEKDEKRSGHRR